MLDLEKLGFLRDDVPLYTQARTCVCVCATVYSHIRTYARCQLMERLAFWFSMLYSTQEPIPNERKAEKTKRDYTQQCVVKKTHQPPGPRLSGTCTTRVEQMLPRRAAGVVRTCSKNDRQITLRRAGHGKEAGQIEKCSSTVPVSNCGVTSGRRPPNSPIVAKMLTSVGPKRTKVGRGPDLVRFGPKKVKQLANIGRLWRPAPGNCPKVPRKMCSNILEAFTSQLISCVPSGGVI